MERWGDGVPIRFLTSFNHALYATSGRRCVETFRELNSHYELLSYVEAPSNDELEALRREVEWMGSTVIHLRDLRMLEEFRERAKEFIPVELGGEAPADLFPGDGPGTGAIWFRKHMYRWFRKVVALNHAMTNFEGVIVWMDCDCYSKKSLPRRVIARAFDDAAIFFMKGNRAYSETGFVGYDLRNADVRCLIGQMTRHYLELEFAGFPRWDDCFTFDLVRARYPRQLCRDIGGTAREYGHILCTTILAPYLEHDKGLHSRRTGLIR
jgi:hypothetical protein